jgi:UbiD family decarboxylase
MGQYLRGRDADRPAATAFPRRPRPIPDTTRTSSRVAARLSRQADSARRCKHIDLMVPGRARRRDRGALLPNERRDEGPFGEFNGY